MHMRTMGLVLALTCAPAFAEYAPDREPLRDRAEEGSLEPSGALVGPVNTAVPGAPATPFARVLPAGDPALVSAGEARRDVKAAREREALLQREIRELTQSASDVVSFQAAPAAEALLVPFALALEAQGLGPHAALLESLRGGRSDTVLTRINQAIQERKEQLTAVEVQRFRLEQSLEARTNPKENR